MPFWSTKRKLTKVLDHEKCKYYGFGFQNTIMIDSDFYKVKDYRENSIIIKEYDESQVIKSTED